MNPKSDRDQREDIEGVSPETLDGLFDRALKAWIEIVKQSADEWDYRDVPWWYNERAQLSLFAGAIWRTGGSVFEEFGMTKKGEDAPYTGRCDFYCRSDDTTFIGEAKHLAVSTLDGFAGKKLQDALDLASDDCASCTSEHEGLLAILFVTLRIPKSKPRDEIARIIQNFCSSIRKLSPTAAAWVFPARARFHVASSKSIHYHPGGAILIERVKSPKTPAKRTKHGNISELIEKLRNTPSSGTVNNQYRNEAQLENVQRYLEALCTLSSCDVLLVGESPGHRGCAITGIPFTSEAVLKTSASPFLQELRTKLKISGSTSENTATELWTFIEKAQKVPALWNIVPFHAHKANKRTSNRTPTAREAEAGLEIVELLIEILKPKQIIAVGRVAQEALGKRYENVPYVRHPARGGRSLFRKGLAPFLGI